MNQTISQVELNVWNLMEYTKVLYLVPFSFCFHMSMHMDLILIVMQMPYRFIFVYLLSQMPFVSYSPPFDIL